MKFWMLATLCSVVAAIAAVYITYFIVSCNGTVVRTLFGLACL